LGLDVVRERCAGIDVHKRQITVHVRAPGNQEAREFATDTSSLLTMVDWLQELRIVDVAMEGTGSYWKPVYNILEACGLKPIIGNASHMKAVPGRKTDVKDAEWICDLHRHGLIRASFVPPRAQRELRELVTYRSTLIAERASEANRIAKVLEGGNIKLSSVVTDILGKSSRNMLAALARGEDNPTVLADMAEGKLKSKRDDLLLALHGRMTAHQRKMLGWQLQHVEFLDAQIRELDAKVAECLDPHEQEIERLCTIPGVSVRSAEVILAAIGTDMKQFPSADHLISWAGMCPASNESGGKRRPARTRHGNELLKATMVQAGQAAGRSIGTYLGATYRLLAARRGKKKAAVAVGRHILQTAYYILRDGTEYQELGANFHDERRKEAVKRRAIARLQRLGYEVTVQPVA
jgi:transposase